VNDGREGLANFCFVGWVASSINLSSFYYFAILLSLGHNGQYMKSRRSRKHLPINMQRAEAFVLVTNLSFIASRSKSFGGVK
jgi:hypothetical protein